MKANSIIDFLIKAAIIAGIIYLISKDHQKSVEFNAQINAINSVKKEIWKSDSVQDIRERATLDSLRRVISRSTLKLNQIDVINKKLNQQNEKLDKVYNSISVDMPDL